MARPYLLVAAALAVLSLVGAAPGPDFCRGLDCPKYVQESRETYLIRTYEASTWASTGFRESSFVGAAMRGAYRIYRYIWGHNEQSARLEMTSPISILVNETSHAHCHTNCPRRSYLVNYFLPFAYQEDAPKPSSEKMCIHKLPEIRVALIEFGGYPTPQHVWDKRDELHSLLKMANMTFDNRTFLVNVYDSPFHWSKRHNEVAVFLCKNQRDEVAPDGGCDTGIPDLDALIPLAADEPKAPSHPVTAEDIEPTLGESVGPSTLEHYPHDVAGEKGIPHTHSSGDPRLDKEAPPEYRAAVSEKVLEEELPKHMKEEHGGAKQEGEQKAAKPAPAPPKVKIDLEAVKEAAKEAVQGKGPAQQKAPGEL